MNFRQLVSVILLVLFASIMVSCGEDDKNEVNDLLGDAAGNLVGTWVYVESDGYTETAVFNTDGTGSITAQFPNEAPDTSLFTYTVSGNTIDIVYEDQENDDPDVTYVLNGSQLTLTFSFPEGDQTVTTYVRAS